MARTDNAEELALIAQDIGAEGCVAYNEDES
jgi:hypothetical protein